MSNRTTATMTPEAFKRWEHQTSIKVGEYWLSIPNEHAAILRKGEAADITYTENEKNGKTYYNIVEVNGQSTARQQRSATGPGSGSSGPGKAGPGSSPASGPADVKPNSGDQNSWAGMGPENRARMAVKEIIAARYNNEKLDLGGSVELGAEMQIVYQAWLSGVEGKGMPPAGNVGNSGALPDAPDYGDDPGPSGPDDYDRA